MVDDALPLIWGKLVINAAINPLTALLQIKNGELLDNPSALEFFHELAKEAAAVANSSGIELPYSDPSAVVDEVARTSADNSSSMLQDVLRGAQTEIDSINGKIIDYARKNGIPVPYNRGMWLLIKALSVRGNN